MRQPVMLTVLLLEFIAPVTHYTLPTVPCVGSWPPINHDSLRSNDDTVPVTFSAIRDQVLSLLFHLSPQTKRPNPGQRHWIRGVLSMWCYYHIYTVRFVNVCSTAGSLDVCESPDRNLRIVGRWIDYIPAARSDPCMQFVITLPNTNCG